MPVNCEPSGRKGYWICLTRLHRVSCNPIAQSTAMEVACVPFYRPRLLHSSVGRLPSCLSLASPLALHGLTSRCQCDRASPTSCTTRRLRGGEGDDRGSHNIMRKVEVEEGGEGDMRSSY